ncbi:SDR family NAD(P)-dependent oxidoreductase [Chryseobacterium sp. BIGb0232]|uniref:SDR family NAD(P)-dependent oxidoreductase n=1 Tax=Chryseobacterium sp. BIGb0232 TaxID=2940598 RepID=UPI000FB697F2|nr:SDR family NAD(P)-dependent oxidoreductase [Chryseobacterium sp. BIGb0232]MCS4302681.1 NAD(P)-dependent dehydrogenase (short-subunit alcohol dehydrogenase family) [Chryseobacterium sp. BIGb0232]ROS17335.1 short subunit dehydrogenase [Chryseobacterium nakagawai]
MKNKRILITGANIGLGKEAARQLTLIPETEKIYLGCRNRQKAEKAKKDLEKSTGRKIFEIMLLDVSDAESVRRAVKNIEQSIDALILNAGGQGGKDPLEITETGMTNIAATNLLGHVVLVDEIIKAKKLNNEVVYVSSEGARGIKGVMKKPNLKANSVAEFISVLNGSFSDPKLDGSEAYGYGYIKYIGALWTSANARLYPEIKFISVSPGNTRGTAGYDDLPTLTRVMFKYVLAPIVMPLIGMIIV